MAVISLGSKFHWDTKAVTVSGSFCRCYRYFIRSRCPSGIYRRKTEGTGYKLDYLWLTVYIVDEILLGRC